MQKNKKIKKNVHNTGAMQKHFLLNPVAVENVPFYALSLDVQLVCFNI